MRLVSLSDSVVRATLRLRRRAALDSVGSVGVCPKSHLHDPVGAAALSGHAALHVGGEVLGQALLGQRLRLAQHPRRSTADLALLGVAVAGGAQGVPGAVGLSDAGLLGVVRADQQRDRAPAMSPMLLAPARNSGRGRPRRSL